MNSRASETPDPGDAGLVVVEVVEVDDNNNNHHGNVILTPAMA